MPSFPAPLDAIVAALETDRETLRAAVARVPADARDRRPAPDRWSVAEILEHLAIVEERTVTILGDALAKAPARDPAAAIPAQALIFDREALRDRTQTLAAPEAIRPTGTMDAAAAWSRLERSRAALLQALGDVGERDLGAVRRPHPRLGPLTGYQWIAALGGHEERHALQIAEIAAALGG